MKKSKIDIYEMSRKLNTFCESSRKMNKSYSGSELNEALTNLGFSKVIASAIAQKCFPFEQMGKSRLYDIPKDPIHKDVLRSLYDRQNNYAKKSRGQETKPHSVNNTEEAWQTLLDAGVIKRKFNLETLKSKYPSIYLECLEYEIVK